MVDNTECVLDELRVRACSKQIAQLRAWAAPFPDRVWAIESARGLGYDAAALEAALGARGHNVNVATLTSGLGVIHVRPDGLLGGADLRRDGTVGGR